MNVIEPPSDDKPSKCSASIAILTEVDTWYTLSESGTYTVQPVLKPSDRDIDNSTTTLDAANMYNDAQFNLGSPTVALQ